VLRACWWVCLSAASKRFGLGRLVCFLPPVAQGFVAWVRPLRTPRGPFSDFVNPQRRWCVELLAPALREKIDEERGFMALRHSVGDLAGTVLSMLRTRLELFSLEAADEKSRLIRILCMAFGALLLMSLALLAFSIAVALYFWPTEARYLAIGTLALIYALMGLGLFWGVWNGLTKG